MIACFEHSIIYFFPVYRFDSRSGIKRKSQIWKIQWSNQKHFKKTKLFNDLIDFAYILIISFSEIVKPSIDFLLHMFVKTSKIDQIWSTEVFLFVTTYSLHLNFTCPWDVTSSTISDDLMTMTSTDLGQTMQTIQNQTHQFNFIYQIMVLC